MVSLALVGLGLFCWPARPSRTRLRALRPAEGPRRHRVPRPGLFGTVTGLGALGWILFGPGAGVAAALLGVVGCWRWRSRRRLLASLAGVDGLAEALRSLVAGLRAGAHPADAAELAAADAEPQAAGAMRAISAAARLDGDVDRALDSARTGPPLLAAALDRLAKAWVLAGRHGLPLAEVLDAVGRDLEQRARFARQVVARMAGPRASATVLALLPVVGVVLGEAMGARPLHLLAGTSGGQLLLVAGVGLLCAGVVWSTRLTEQAVLR